MKRLTVGAVLAGLGLCFVGRSAAAQLQNIPVYFSPKGGTGLTLAGDFGRVASAKVDNVTSGIHPTAIGGRASLGLPIVTVGVGAAIYDPKIQP